MTSVSVYATIYTERPAGPKRRKGAIMINLELTAKACQGENVDVECQLHVVESPLAEICVTLSFAFGSVIKRLPLSNYQKRMIVTLITLSMLDMLEVDK